MSINSRIADLNVRLAELEKYIAKLPTATPENYIIPITTTGGNRSRATITPIDYKSGLSNLYGGPVIWNTSEIGCPPTNVETTIDESTAKGYNKHSHSRFSGGALIKGTVEIVDYDFVETPITNKHSQGYWVTQPKIKKELNTKQESVEKIGQLDLVFNPDKGYDADGKPIGSWGCPTYEIDVRRCYLVERVTTVDDINTELGAIKKDSKGQEMKSPLYNDDPTKTSVVWDVNGNCWRFYAVYAPDPSLV